MIDKEQRNSVPAIVNISDGENSVMTAKSKEDLILICKKWINEGYGDESFWEPWPECPTPELKLTPNALLSILKADQGEMS